MNDSEREQTAIAGGSMIALGTAAKVGLGATALTNAAGAGVVGTKVAAAATALLGPVGLIGVGVGCLAVAGISYLRKKK